MRVVTHWNRLPGELVDSPALEMWRSWLATALNILVALSLLWAGRLQWPSPDMPSSLSCFVPLLGAVRIPPLDCCMLTQNKHQCLRIPQHFPAFCFSVGAARNAMGMARDVINSPVLQWRIHTARHMKRKTHRGSNWDIWFQYSVQGAGGCSLRLEAFQLSNITTVHSPTKDWD